MSVTAEVSPLIEFNEALRTGSCTAEMISLKSLIVQHTSSNTLKEKEYPMKKIMSLMLGLGLALGCTSLFAQDAATGATATTGKEKKAKHHKKAKKDTAAPAEAPAK